MFIREMEWIRNGDYVLAVRKMYRDKPSKRNIILVHGVTYSSHQFDLQYGDYSLAEYLAGAGYTVWMPDITGFGLSEKPADGFFCDSLRGRDDIVCVAEHILFGDEGERLDILGWSWGTVTASLAAAALSETIGRLVLFAPIQKGLGGPAVEEPWHPNSREHASEDFPRDETGLPDTEKIIAPVLELTLANCAEYDGEWSPNGGRRDISREKNAELFVPEEITVPVLVIGGTADSYMDWANIGKVFMRLLNENKRMRILENGSHSLLFEKAHYRKFREEILDFLNA